MRNYKCFLEARIIEILYIKNDDHRSRFRQVTEEKTGDTV